MAPCAACSAPSPKTTTSPTTSGATHRHRHPQQPPPPAVVTTRLSDCHSHHRLCACAVVRVRWCVCVCVCVRVRCVRVRVRVRWCVCRRNVNVCFIGSCGTGKSTLAGHLQLLVLPLCVCVCACRACRVVSCRVCGRGVGLTRRLLAAGGGPVAGGDEAVGRQQRCRGRQGPGQRPSQCQDHLHRLPAQGRSVRAEVPPLPRPVPRDI